MNSPKPQPCHSCALDFIGAVCPKCGTERAAFTAMKSMAAKANLEPCPYFPGRECDCGLKFTCLEAA